MSNPIPTLRRLIVDRYTEAIEAAERERDEQLKCLARIEAGLENGGPRIVEVREKPRKESPGRTPDPSSRRQRIRQAILDREAGEEFTVNCIIDELCRSPTHSLSTQTGTILRELERTGHVKRQTLDGRGRPGVWARTEKNCA